jgi:hypothetical protein
MVACGTTPEVWQVASLKTCTKCLTSLPLDMFSRRAGVKLRATCRTCVNAAERTRCSDLLSGAWQKKSERYARWNTKRLAQGRPMPNRSEAQAAWRLRDPEKTRMLRRAKYLRDKNKPGYQEKQTAYMRQKRTDDPAFKFASYQRARLWGAINGGKRKGGRLSELLGCKPIEAIKILTNGGIKIPDGVHVDHHVPVSSFDLNNIREQFICFNWRNLRLLTKEENERKHSRVPADAQIIMAEIASTLSLDSAHL